MWALEVFNDSLYMGMGDGQLQEFGGTYEGAVWVYGVWTEPAGNGILSMAIGPHNRLFLGVGGEAGYYGDTGSGIVYSYDGRGEPQRVSSTELGTGVQVLYDPLTRDRLGGESQFDTTIPLQQGETRHLAVNLPAGQSQANFLVEWTGSTVDTTLVAPDGTIISSDTIDPRVYHAKGLAYELYWVTDAQPGEWTINLFGADLPPAGQDITVQVFSIALHGIASGPTATGTGTALFTPSHGNIEDLKALPEMPPGAPHGITFPHGLFKFKVTEISPGDTVALTIDLPEPVPVGTRWWKYQNGGWYSLPNEDDNGDNTMTIMLTDGGLGDADQVADGVITDPGGPGIRQRPPTAGAAYPGWTALLAGLMGVASLLMLRRPRGGQESA